MGPGRRFRGGRRGRRLTEELRKLIKLHMNDYSSVDHMVQKIRCYQNYSRISLSKLSRDVSLILQEEQESLESSKSHPRKKMKKFVDEDEEKLHCSYSKNAQLERSESESDSDSGSCPNSSAVTSSIEEPKFDLMKSMLRKTYSAKAAKMKETENEKATKTQLQLSTSMINRGSKGDNLSGVVVDEGPRFKDIGGMEEVLSQLELEILLPLYQPLLPKKLGVNTIRGLLFHGPPGCGKTMLAHAIANETGLSFYKISATEIVSGISGAAEENIRELFSKAYRTAPSIIFIDEIEAIASKRENLQRGMERRIVTELTTCMDRFHMKAAEPSNSNLNSDYVLVIGATNMPDDLDPALRKPGRFDREIRLGVPDENARFEILSVLVKKCTLERSFDLLQIARGTPGFVAADLCALVDNAGNLAMQRILGQKKSQISKDSVGKQSYREWLKIPWSPEEFEKLSITMDDFEKAAKLVQPTLKREGFSTIPDVKWEDIAGLQSVRNNFQRLIVKLVKYPEKYQEYAENFEKGILLYGPPGCGKTLIAKAVANEAGINFIHINGPELLDKYVGESEKAIRTLFYRARTCAPCIIFFDEFDAITTNRGNEGGWVVERLVNQLLGELDGKEQQQGVYVIGATNRPNMIDPAILRPGRFGKHIYIPLPSAHDRGLILKAVANKGKGKPVDSSVDLFSIGRICENFSGADLRSLIGEATIAAQDEIEENNASEETSFTIKEHHFQIALTKIKPFVSEEQLQDYKDWAARIKRC